MSANIQTFSMDTHKLAIKDLISVRWPSNLDLYEKDKVNVWAAT